MRKEVIFAAIAGILIGAVIAFGVWRANSALLPQNKETEPIVAQEADANFSDGKLGLTIAKPEEADVITQNPTNLTGLTKPNALVVVSTEDEDFTLNADSTGNFSQDIDLADGVNQLIVTVFDTDGTSVSKQLTIAYSTELAKN